MMDEIRMTLAEVEELAQQALVACGCRVDSAAALARSIAATERSGIRSHGLFYVPTYCEHLKCGKVLGDAIPVVTQPGTTAVVVDAASGFAHRAIDAGFEKLIPLAKEHGCAAMAVRNSYNCGVLGYHVERLAKAGLVGLGFTNAPASIAPAGGRKPVVGTNPFALAAPDGNGNAAFIIDQSASVVAKSEIMLSMREGRDIPLGWGLNAEGEPTTSAQEALDGSMAPSGGYKGFGVGMMVELFAAAISGATLAKDASPFSGTAGGPPKTGQFFFAVDADVFSGGVFNDRLSDIVKAISSQPGARLPGSKRLAAYAVSDRDGVPVSVDLIEKIKSAMQSS